MMIPYSKKYYEQELAKFMASIKDKIYLTEDDYHTLAYLELMRSEPTLSDDIKPISKGHATGIRRTARNMRISNKLSRYCSKFQNPE